jgi:hypothetical protein
MIQALGQNILAKNTHIGQNPSVERQNQSKEVARISKSHGVDTQDRSVRGRAYEELKLVITLVSTKN